MPVPRLLLVAALALIAAGYFALGRDLGIEWVDTGMLVYPSWRVARGEIPYRDFYQLFGPSLFYVNALVMRLFGEDLGALRLWVLGLKVAIALLVYLEARRLASWPFALAAFAVLVVIWGTPFWIFNAPYANHYAVALQLIALWLLSAPIAAQARARCAAAGLCLGLAMTFKQTSGPFAAAGLALALVSAPPAWLPDGAASLLPAPLRRALRLAIPIGALGLCALYMAPRNTAANGFLLGTPVALLAAACVRRELGRTPDPAPLSALLWIGLGMALPLLGYAAFFAAHGALDALAFNTVRGLPDRIAWFQPLPLPPLRTLAALAAGGIALLALRRQRSGLRWHVLAVVAVALASAALLDTLRRPLANYAWYGEVYALFTWLAVVLVWASALAVLRARTPPTATPMLFIAAAAVALMYLYPVADIWHLFMALPLLLPLAARQAERLGLWAAASGERSDAPDPARRVATPGVPAGLAASGIALAVLLCAPFVDSFVDGWRAAQPTGLARASGVRDTSPRGAAAAEIARLTAAQPAERRVFVLGYDPLLLFAGERASAVGAEDFLFYMVATKTVRGRGVAQLLPDAALRDRLATERPLLIEVAGPTAQRVRAAYPLTAAYIDAHAEPVRSVEPYHVLEWRE